MDSSYTTSYGLSIVTFALLFSHNTMSQTTDRQMTDAKLQHEHNC